MYDFNGKRALVTGAGRGIGREIVKQLSKYGAHVIALSKTRENLESLKSELPSIETICVDLGDWKATRQAVEKLQTIDLLVNNAGVLEEAVFETITEEQFDKTFNVNVKAIINISQVIAKKLKDENKPGSVVNISSVSSWFNYTGEAVYGLSKATVDKLTKLMAKELGPSGIRVNSVNPTWVLTEMAMQLLSPENEAQLKSKIPLGKFCDVKDIADAVLFLLSDNAKMVNGVHFPVDGGEQ
ncbi:L-xylulose reductase-like [Centruroides vittatus]|uniref:L-xylulose reductase-like n=1 Tax=Centruroides vittatus TaxID=120091 RepID=UPI003510D1F2